jgi:hypothetical protein
VQSLVWPPEACAPQLIWSGYLVEDIDTTYWTVYRD